MPSIESEQSLSRLVSSPVFIISTMRSGSTLLRVLLNSHSMIRAPHEMHLQTLRVEFAEFYTARVVEESGLGKPELEHLLWDRILHKELMASGKRIIVEKTPANALSWRRLNDCWPGAKYIYLLRHPASVLASMLELSRDAVREDIMKIAPDRVDMTSGSSVTRPGAGQDAEASSMESGVISNMIPYIQGIDEAMQALPGHIVRYEDLVDHPAEVTSAICSFLGVPWEPQMIDYGKKDHGRFGIFMGDYTDKIKSGRICARRPVPSSSDVPIELRAACRNWGYL